MREFGSIPEPASVAVQSTAITDLIAKLEAAVIGRRALDALIVAASDHRPAWLSKSDGQLWADLNGPLPVVRWQEAGMKRSSGNPQAYGLAPEVTTSLDAIVGLIERKLPGWIIETLGEHTFADHRAKGPWRATLRSSPNLPGLTYAQCHYARTAPLAFCIAFLKATETTA